MLAFLAVAIAVVVTPGPDMLLVMRNTLLGGRLAGAATVLGVIGGIGVWATLAVGGIAALLAASALAFTILKLAGAGYLVYLGLRAIRSGAAPVEIRHGPRPTFRTAASQGFLSAALNPKLGVFFLTLLPQFSDPLASPLHSLALAVAFAAIGLAWLLLFTAFVGEFGRLLSSPTVVRRIQRLSGAVLIALGLRVAAERA